MHIFLLTIYSLVWVGIIYGFNRWLAGKRLHIKPVKALMYITTMAALGVLGEVAFDTVYNFIFGHPLWLYQIYPIHHGYTSIYSLYLWGAVGFYIYMLHGTLKKKHMTSVIALTAIFCFDAIALEILINLTYIDLFKSYVFYYLPGDLWHLTSLKVIPLYLIAGMITVYTFEYEKTHHKNAIIYSTAIAVCIVGSGILINQ